MKRRFLHRAVSCAGAAVTVSYLRAGWGVLGKERTRGRADLQKTGLLVAAVLLSHQILRLLLSSGTSPLRAVAARQRSAPSTPVGTALPSLRDAWGVPAAPGRGTRASLGQAGCPHPHPRPHGGDTQAGAPARPRGAAAGLLLLSAEVSRAVTPLQVSARLCGALGRQSTCERLCTRTACSRLCSRFCENFCDTLQWPDKGG